MKKSILLSLVLALSVALFAQEKKIVEFVEKNNTHDFGTVQETDGQNGRISHVFTFKNVSTTPVFITDIQPGCSCTASNYDKNKIILPGETGTFTISYTVAGRAGQSIGRTIPVTFKDGSDNVYKENVMIKGQVASKEQAVQSEQVQKAEQPQNLQQSQRAQQVQKAQQVKKSHQPHKKTEKAKK